MIDVSAWVAHATREPSEEFLRALDRRWRDGIAVAAEGPCPPLADPLHSFVIAHVDRAAHKRRWHLVVVLPGDAGTHGHGFTPMSDLITGDIFGPQSLDVVHCGTTSTLATAMELAKSDPHVLAVPVLTERQFADIDVFDAHSASLLRPEYHGVVLPFMYAPLAEPFEETEEREDLLRASGFGTYTIDVDFTEHEPADVHRNVAVLLEDLCDEISSNKADAAARVLLSAPLWPLVTVRAPDTWDPDRHLSASAAALTDASAPRELP
ncbi:hypothetical protein [Demequina sp. NBRC 110055]|uniref:hypothetical protein n=1 Tax=Demequina sp. NBRC 110055 TaxID=1570344 RepID=UPI000A00419C|nr:hypothetical protein [Demequina sp. NBRC 110055]